MSGAGSIIGDHHADDVLIIAFGSACVGDFQLGTEAAGLARRNAMFALDDRIKQLRTDLDAARARVAELEGELATARNDALEEAAKISTDQANEDRALLKAGLIDYEPAGAAILTSVNIAKAIRAARTHGGTDGRA